MLRRADLARGLIASCRFSPGRQRVMVLPAPGAYRGIGRGLGAYPASPHCPGLKLDPKDNPGTAECAVNSRGWGRLCACRGERGWTRRLKPPVLRDKVALTEAEPPPNRSLE